MATADTLSLVSHEDCSLHGLVGLDLGPSRTSKVNGILRNSSSTLNGEVDGTEKHTNSSYPIKKPVKVIPESLQPAAVYPPLTGKSKFELETHGIDEVRSLRVVVIGAGLAGITAGILLPIKVPKIDLTIYEKNDDVVGQSHETLNYTQQS